MDLSTLMRRIQQGDKEAFATLYTRYNKTVFRIALEATHSADEAVQIVKAVFREMYQTIRSKGPYLGDLYGWLDALTAKQIRLRRLTQGMQPAAQQQGAKPRRYTEEEAAEIEARALARIQNTPKQPEEEKKKTGTVSGIVLGITALALLWVLIGLLGTLHVLPQWELGYTWFNQTLFPLF